MACALNTTHAAGTQSAWHHAAAASDAALTRRQRDVMAMVLAVHPSKVTTADQGISQRRVENHRAAIVHETDPRSLPELARLAMAAVA